MGCDVADVGVWAGSSQDAAPRRPSKSPLHSRKTAMSRLHVHSLDRLLRRLVLTPMYLREYVDRLHPAFLPLKFDDRETQFIFIRKDTGPDCVPLRA